MTLLYSAAERLRILFEGLIEGNEPRHFILSALILAGGFLALEFVWRRVLKRIERLREVGMAKRWRAYLSSFAPTIHLLIAVVLIHAAQLPLELPEGIEILLGGLKSFLMAVAIILFVFQSAQVFDIFYETLVFRRAGKEAPEHFLEGKPWEEVESNVKGVARILGIVAASIFFVYTQKELFPPWIWDSPWWRYAALLAAYAFIIAGGRMLLAFLRALTASLKEATDQVQLRLVIQATLWPVRLLCLAIALFITRETLPMPGRMVSIFDSVVNSLGVLVVLVFIYKLLDVVEYEVTRFVKREDNEFDMNLVQMVRIVLRIIVVVFGFIYLVKAATGQPMTSFLAGLGIGGLAVALAAQDTLKNLFGSFMIMMDKPFVVGDQIILDGNSVIVEEIGFRSTKLRTFTGHLMYVPNEKMASVTIENVRKRPFVRRNMDITVTYDTPPDKVEKAVELVREILKTHESELHPDYPVRVHFNEFNDASLNILVSYWYKHNDYWGAVEFGEKINFGIMRAFEKEGVEFAFPTTTTYLAHDQRRPLRIAVRNENFASGDSDVEDDDTAPGRKR